MAETMSTAGAMKQAPVTRSPGRPARMRPRCMAISVELGPGIRFVAPRRSRNASRVSHLRRFTTSSSIMAIWARGPPKAVVPSRRKRKASSRSRTVLPGVSSPAIIDIEAAPRSVLMRRRVPPDEQRIEGPAAAAHDEEEDESEEHREVGPGLVEHGPKPVGWAARGGEPREAGTQQDRDFGRDDGHRDVHQERDRGQPRQQADQDQEAEQDLDAPHERSQDLR